MWVGQRKSKKSLCTCKRTLHNQVYGMTIGAPLVLHHQVVGPRVVLVRVEDVQRGQVTVLPSVRLHVVGPEAICGGVEKEKKTGESLLLQMPNANWLSWAK